MLHLAAYIMAPFMGAVMAAPAPQSSVVPGGTTTTIAVGLSENVSDAENQDLVTQLQNAGSAVARLKLLPNNQDHVYDFNKPPVGTASTTGMGGHTVKSDRLTFPALVGTGVSMTVGFIGPCGFNTPHTHPRSSEINIITQGSLGTEFITENGAPVIRNILTQYQMTVFPQGALHAEFNPNCDPAVFVAGFASEDPGVLQAAQNLFGLDDDLVTAVLGADFTFDGADIDKFRTQLPANVAKGVDSCLTKCGIPKRK